MWPHFHGNGNPVVQYCVPIRPKSPDNGRSLTSGMLAHQCVHFSVEVSSFNRLSTLHCFLSAAFNGYYI